ncbi:MAG: O-antigen ligase family protein [Actinobacteria bacterium]|nr:O-antigen ligase family protein [Actinomycetota bacterium]
MPERTLVTLASRVFVAIGVLIALLAAWALVSPHGWEAMAAGMALLGGAAILAALFLLGPTYMTCLAIILTVLSGHWKEIGSPLPLDRVAIVLAFASILSRPEMRRVCIARARTPIGILLGCFFAYGVISSAAAGTLSNSGAYFGLLDNLGLIPFAMYIVAPVVFRTEQQRDVLLWTLIGIGAYLGLTALFETIGARSLVFPRYINNPLIGIHYGRARGPFVEAVADGLAMYVCGIAAAIAWYRWRGGKRAFAAFVVLLCTLGAIFTLTRSVWLAAALGTIGTLLFFRQTRRYSIVVALVGAVAAVGALVLIPGFSSKASEREGSQVPVWDRLNTDAAALRVIEAEPIFGAGWMTFERDGAKYLRQSSSYPLTGAGLNVHNVFLARAAELGFVGTALWLVAFGIVVFQGAIRAGPDEMLPWRMGFIAVVISWIVVALFAPLTYPFSNMFLWLWAGLLMPLPATEAVARVRSRPRPAPWGPEPRLRETESAPV